MLGRDNSHLGLLRNVVGQNRERAGKRSDRGSRAVFTVHRDRAAGNQLPGPFDEDRKSYRAIVALRQNSTNEVGGPPVVINHEHSRNRRNGAYGRGRQQPVDQPPTGGLVVDTTGRIIRRSTPTGDLGETAGLDPNQPGGPSASQIDAQDRFHHRGIHPAEVVPVHRSEGGRDERERSSSVRIQPRGDVMAIGHAEPRRHDDAHRCRYVGLLEQLAHSARRQPPGEIQTDRWQRHRQPAGHARALRAAPGLRNVVEQPGVTDHDCRDCDRWTGMPVSS